MPWFDLFIILLLLYGAYRGHQRGFVGALRGIIGSIFGLLTAWLLTPLTVAWINERYQFNEKIVLVLRTIMPNPMQEGLSKLNSAITSLQELKRQLLTLPMPEGMMAYLEKAVQDSDSAWQAELTLDVMIDAMLGNFAHAIVTAIAFLIIYQLVAFIVRSFLGLFTSSSGIGLLGVVDGVLGMFTHVAIEILLLTVLIGALYPIIMVRAMEENSHFIYKVILDSFSGPWMNRLYLHYLLPLFT